MSVKEYMRDNKERGFENMYRDINLLKTALKQSENETAVMTTSVMTVHTSSLLVPLQVRVYTTITVGYGLLPLRARRARHQAANAHQREALGLLCAP